MNFVTISIVLILIVSCCHGDYTCLCNYNVETPVYGSADKSANPIGYMYEFDCKYLITNNNPAWDTIAFQQEMGFVEHTDGIEVQICPGNVPDIDKLTTSSVSKTRVILSSTTTTSTTETNNLISTTFSSSLPHLSSSVAAAILSSLTSPLSPSSSTTASTRTSSSSSSLPLSSTKQSTTNRHSSSLTVHFSGVSSNTYSKSYNSSLSSAFLPSSSASSPSSSSSSVPVSLQPRTTQKYSSSIIPSSDVPSYTYSKPYHKSSSSSTQSSLSISFQSSNTTRDPSSWKTRSSTVHSNTYSSPYHSFFNNLSSSLNGFSNASSFGTYFPLSNSSSTLFHLLSTSLSPPKSSSKLATNKSTELPPTQTNDSSLATNHNIPPFTDIIPPDVTTSVTYTTNSSNSLSSQSHHTIPISTNTEKQINSTQLPDHSGTKYSVVTPATSTNFSVSPEIKMTSTETLLSSGSTFEETSTPFVPYTQFPNITASGNTTPNYNGSSTKPVPVSGRVDLCPYKNLAMSLYNITAREYPLFRQYDHYCYELRLELGSWFEGQSDCVNRDGELVVIKSKEVLALIYNLTSSLAHKLDVWIGLHDLHQEGRWEWVDGEELTKPSFNNGILINRVYSDARDCVLMDGLSGIWKNSACQSMLFDVHTHPWICQYNLNSGILCFRNDVTLTAYKYGEWREQLQDAVDEIRLMCLVTLFDPVPLFSEIKVKKLYFD